MVRPGLSAGTLLARLTSAVQALVWPGRQQLSDALLGDSPLKRTWNPLAVSRQRWVLGGGPSVSHHRGATAC